MLQHTCTEKMQCWDNCMEPLLNETWKIFKILVEVCPLSACTLHHMYITTGKQLLCLNPEKKPKTWLPWRNLTAYTDIIRPVKKTLKLRIQTLKNVKIYCFIHCNHWKMCVNIKNIWNDNYYKYTSHRWVSHLKEDETGVGFGFFFSADIYQ